MKKYELPSLNTIRRTLEDCLPDPLPKQKMEHLAEIVLEVIDGYRKLRNRPKVPPPSIHKDSLRKVANAAQTILDHLVAGADHDALVVNLKSRNPYQQLIDFEQGDLKPTIKALFRIQQNANTLLSDEEEFLYWRHVAGAHSTRGESDESEYLWRPAVEMWTIYISGERPGTSENGPFVRFVACLHELAGAPVLSGYSLSKALGERLLPEPATHVTELVLKRLRLELENRPDQELGRDPE